MATIQVLHSGQEISTYKNARNWVIDPSGRLHVTSNLGNYASFNADHWESVEFVPDPK